MLMNDCIFCQIIAGTIPTKPVYQDEHVIVIPDIHPAAPVHLLVIPKKHVADVLEAEKAVLADLMTVIQKVIRQQNIRDFRLVHNGQGAAAIAHLHIHVMGQVDKNRVL